MTAVDVICERAAQVSAITALVGTRIWGGPKVPQEPTLPAVHVTLVSDVTTPHLRGIVKRSRARVQVDAIAREASGHDAYAEANDVAAAILGDGAGSALAGWVGELSSPAVTVAAILPLDRRDGYFADDRRQLVVSRDFVVIYDWT